MRTFEKFPENARCPMCGTNEDKECFLIPIDGTDDGCVCEAQPAHTECLKIDGYRYNKVNGIIYRFI